jgi:hypothetical protein
MRRWLYIGLLLLPLLACEREWANDIDASDPEGEVEITFTVTRDDVLTKTLGEDPGLTTMHVAVFGSSHYLKQYVKATPVRTTDRDSTGTSIKMPQYTFSVKIGLSNSRRFVHFIGNGPESIPFGKDFDVLPTLIGEQETGFWQMREVPGIYAEVDGNGDYINKEGGKWQKGDDYVASEKTKKYFRDVPLIRNWAKVLLYAEPVGTSHFIPHSFAIVNMPKRGTLVPYGGTKGFITNYKDLTFDDLTGDSYQYTGNLPDTVEFDPLPPTADEFEHPENFPNTRVRKYVVPSDPDKDDELAAVYLYERPIPNSELQPTYVIMYGEYKDSDYPDGVMCYYKVDLMSGGQYYPILRNFKYRINVRKISAVGHNSPEEAAAGAGSADVSADINASHLPDISDGTRRMAIQPWMAKTFIREEKKKERLYVAFYNDITATDPKPVLDDTTLDGKRYVSYQLIPELEENNIIKEISIGKADTVKTDHITGKKNENYGWRPISFAVEDPDSAVVRSQTLRIVCKSYGPNEEVDSLYRDVVISLMPTQEMRVDCVQDRVLRVPGEKVQLNVSLPDGLIESMFPLEFYVEAVKKTLTPDTGEKNNNLPVLYGPSPVDTTRQAFYFQRTLTWAEYKGLTPRLDFEDDSRWRTFPCYFRTNCDQSATEIYVVHEFFYTENDSFSNFESFSNPCYTSPIPSVSGGTVTVEAGMMTEEDLSEKVYLELKNLKPADEGWTPVSSGPFAGMYAYTPSAKQMSFEFKTTADGGDVAVTLSTESGLYEEVTLLPWHFANVGFVDGVAMPSNTSKCSNVAWGYVSGAEDNRSVLLGFYTDTTKVHPRVWLRGNSGALSIPSEFTSTNGYDLSSQHSGVSNYAGQDNYHWAELTTGTGSMQDASVTLSANGYVEETVSAPRFKGALCSYTLSGSDFDAILADGDFMEEVSDDQITGKFQLYLMSDDPDQKKPSKHTDSNGILLPAGGQYTWDTQIDSDSKDVYPFYVEFTYYFADGALKKPRSAEPEQDESNYYEYSGNRYNYIWTLPYKVSTGRLVMDAYPDRDIVITGIVMRGFRGFLNSTGDTGGGDVDFGGDLGDGGKL